MFGITSLALPSNRANPVLVNLTPWFFIRKPLPDVSTQSMSNGMWTKTLQTVTKEILVLLIHVLVHSIKIITFKIDMVRIPLFALRSLTSSRRRRGLGYCTTTGDPVISRPRWTWPLNPPVTFNKFFIYRGLVYGWSFIADGTLVSARFHAFGIRYTGLDWCREGETSGTTGEFWFLALTLPVDSTVFGYVVGVGNDTRHHTFVCNESIGN